MFTLTILKVRGKNGRWTAHSAKGLEIVGLILARRAEQRFGWPARTVEQ